MSRDPEDGNAKDPASLHKYLYAGGDPVNWIDPSGRDDMIETGDLELQTPAKEEAAEEGEKAEEEGECVADDTASLAAYWASLAEQAPVQSYPFNVINKYSLAGEITGYTFYDSYGNRLLQVELAPGTRHGPGFHVYFQCGKMGFGNGPRGPHVNF